MRPYQVVAEWDDDAMVWVATSDDIPGLVTEADSQDHLVEKLQVIVPELLELNADFADPSGGPDFDIEYKRIQHVRRLFA